MPPLAVIPNRPTGSPDILSFGYGDWLTNAAGTGGMSGSTMSPYGIPWDEVWRRAQAAELAAATQNQFNNDISTGALDVNRQNADTSRYSAETSRKQLGISQQLADTSQFSAETGRYSAEADKAYKEALVKQAADDLAFRYTQLAQTGELERGRLGLGTLQLGASLTGPRNWDRYLETAAAAGQNPLLSRAMDTWSSLTNVRPNTGAVSGPLPERFDLGALASDFMGGGGAPQAGQRNANLDAVAMGRAPAPGWWQGLSDDEKQRSMGYWETHGFSPSSVLNSLAYTSPNQGLGYSGA